MKPVTILKMVNRRREKFENSKIEYFLIAGILLFCLLSLFALWRAGINSRAYIDGPPIIYETQTEAEAYTVLASLRVKGRVLIHFGKHMPMKIRRKKPAAPIDGSNYLYAAAADNLVRKIYGVIPDNSWAATKAKLKKQKSIYAVNGNFISAWADGTPVIAGPLRRLQATEEPVALNFSSDYFAGQAVVPQGVFVTLRRLGVKYDIVIMALPVRTAPHYEETVKKIREFQNYVKQFN